MYLNIVRYLLIIFYCYCVQEKSKIVILLGNKNTDEIPNSYIWQYNYYYVLYHS